VRLDLKSPSILKTKPCVLHARRMRLQVVSAALFCVAVLSARAAETTPAPEWSGGTFATFAHDGPSIWLSFIRQDKRHLIGRFTFENISGSRAQAKDATIEGINGEEGQFWPVIRCEARRAPDTPWESIGESSMDGPRKRLEIKADSPAVELRVTLDIFKPLIGKYYSGRIVLSSGDTSQFELQELTPRTER
jgi:hypothetical protein